MKIERITVKDDKKHLETLTWLGEHHYLRQLYTVTEGPDGEEWEDSPETSWYDGVFVHNGKVVFTPDDVECYFSLLRSYEGYSQVDDGAFIPVICKSVNSYPIVCGQVCYLYAPSYKYFANTNRGFADMYTVANLSSIKLGNFAINDFTPAQ